jgi:Mg2+ and Co2+ transporter CorA
MKEVKNLDRFQVPTLMPRDLADQLSLLIHLHKQKVAIERLPSCNLKKHLMDRICELLEATTTHEEQCGSQTTANHLETISKLQREVYQLQTSLASAEDQLAMATARPQAPARGFRFWPLFFAFIVGYLLAWLKFG